jgi:hypothetical protein
MQAKALIPMLFALSNVAEASSFCPTSMPRAVEAKLLPVLAATAYATQTNDFHSGKYASALDTLIGAKDSASFEALVALLDYPIQPTWDDLISCYLSAGGDTSRKLLELYSRCDIAPSHSPITRNHDNALRSSILEKWHAGHGKGTCARL